ncbi:formyltransferase family protein [Thalassotalea sp. ND16A]|uniref:formyltransferase family protein n=1 Tax=Thalassotalea sp. ND16A TaxID=1535422 RepID=UPI000519FA6A|nr:formyltransferase family protein [Thalassotalea sp. ND16A]KGJ94237.1 Methionyl-tRNA formyltransferase [Thalassotalea sp. ND16A]
MKLAFVTCVQLGLSCMEALYEAGGELVQAFTLEDDRAVNKSGRVYIDKFCKEHSIDLFKLNHVNDQEVINIIKEKEIDWLFIIGWSQIAGKELLDAPKKGVLGMHPTLLPVGRGRAAIPWAIIKGLEETGVTLFKLDEGVDTGPILDQQVIKLDDEMDSSKLYDLVDHAHIQLMSKVTPHILQDTVEMKVQDESKATEWYGRKPEDGAIDLNGSVVDADRLIRAVTSPYPGAFTFIDNEKYVIWRAQKVDKPTSNLCLEFSDGVLECLNWEKV